MPQRGGNGGGSWRTVLIAIVIVAVIIVLSYVELRGFAIPLLNPKVMVMGKATASGFSAGPTRVEFVAQGYTNSSAVSSNESYSVVLQNSKSYKVIEFWEAAGGLYSGNCTAGTLQLNANSTRFLYNVSC